MISSSRQQGYSHANPQLGESLRGTGIILTPGPIFKHDFSNFNDMYVVSKVAMQRKKNASRCYNWIALRAARFGPTAIDAPGGNYSWTSRIKGSTMKMSAYSVGLDLTDR
jgi:hypothetical protein